MSDDNHDSSPVGGDSLDQLLQEARWPTAPQAAVTRLGGHWQQVWSTRRRRELLLRRTAALAIAVSLLAAGTIGWLRLRDPGKTIAETQERPAQATDGKPPIIERRRVVTQSPQPIDAARHETRRPIAMTRTSQNVIINGGNHAPAELAFRTPRRAPNELETLMLAALDRQEGRTSPPERITNSSPKRASTPVVIVKQDAVRRHKVSVATKAMSAEATFVAAAVKRLVSDKSARAVTQIAGELKNSAPSHERFLIEILDHGTKSEQLAALRLLAEVGNRAAIDPALRAAELPALHSAAIETLARLADPALVSQLAVRESEAGLQQLLLAALLARGEPVSLGHYLIFVENDRTAERRRGAAAQSLTHPPMDVLFSAFSDPLEAHRIAAARVIGRIDGTATTRRLITMVELGINRHEACIALLSSRGAEATRYVDAAAQRDPALAAILSGARLFTSSDNPPRS